MRLAILLSVANGIVPERIGQSDELKVESSRLASGRPVTGPPAPGVQLLDAVMDQFMQSVDCQAGALAVARRGVLLYSRGYGWRDRQRRLPTQPGTPMRIASCAKPITAATVKTLIRQGRLHADLPVFPFLGIEPAGGRLGDERLNRITVEQLLKHEAGFDREQAFDPMFRCAIIEQELDLATAATPRNVIEYMLTQPLQFNPGERSCYSNFGYCVLGRVIEKASGKSYLETVKEVICQPLGIDDLTLSRNRIADRPAKEVWYPVQEEAFSIEVMDAHGGLTTSAASLCKFLQAYWISGEPRQPGQHQSWLFFGSLPGTTAMIQQRTDGVDCAILLNGRRPQFNEDNQRLHDAINAAIDRIQRGELE